MSENKIANRRDFIRKSGMLALGSVIATKSLANSPIMNYQSGADGVIKIAVIGCGGRGTGAVIQALSTKQNVKLVAMADAFQDRLDGSLKHIKAKYPDKVIVKDEHKFTGFDAYKNVIPLADVLIIATPPGFRPIHFAEAIKQNKHVFMEKPVAVDTEGIKKVLVAAQEAKRKKLNVVVGLQRHYQKPYIEMMKMIHDGKIGEVLSTSVYWNGGGVWVHPRTPDQNEMEYQMRNWYYFNWLCGDHITEQHVHNIDVSNWAMNDYPVKCLGMGGRQVRKGIQYGEIYDHFFVEYHYKNGVKMNSQCRHIKGCVNNISETIVGTKGIASTHKGYTIKDSRGRVKYEHKGDYNNPYQQEHDELFAAIANNEYKFDDATNAAKSTMCAIMGRMAVYSGQEIGWEAALNSGYSLSPEKYDWEASPPILPNPDGTYPIAIPGKTKYV